MSLFLVLTLVGLGSGAIIAGLTIGLMVVYKGTGVLNFAQGALAMWAAYVYDALTRKGTLVLPWAGLPNTIDFGGPVNRWWALAAGVASAAFLGLLIHVLVMRRMRYAPVLGQVVATIGIMLVIQGLTVLQFGTGVVQGVAPILPSNTFKIGVVQTSVNRLVLAGLALVVAGMVWAWFKYARTGLACRAAAESDKGAVLSGLSPSRLSVITWTGSAALAGLFGVLVAPLVPLSADVYPLLVVPALAAALVGQLSRIWVATIAALLIGCLQASMQFFIGKGYVPLWALNGLPEALPLVLIIGALFVVGKRLPGRSGNTSARLPPVRIPQRSGVWIFGMSAAGILLMFLLGTNYRLALIVTIATMAITLSQVVLTGFVGQISFAQAAIAGTAAFGLSKLGYTLHIPFPFSPILAGLIAVLLGLVVGLPALRTRGSQLAVVTIAAASAIEVFVFQNAVILTKLGLAPVPEPSIAGIRLTPLGANFPRPIFGVFTIVVVAALFFVVGRILGGNTGRRFLSVRSDEVAAAALGIDTTRVKMTAFAVSAMCGAVGGVLFAELRGSVTAEDFVVFVGLSYLAVTYIGGIGTMAGAVIGGFAVNNGILTVLLNRYVEFGDWYLLVTGVILVISAVDNPEGIAIRARRLFDQVRLRRTSRHEPTGPVDHQAAGDPGPAVVRV